MAENNAQFDYESEFIDYIKDNCNNFNEVYKFENSNYSLFEKELIKNVNSEIDELLHKMSSPRGISPDIHVYCVNSEDVNAFCFVVNKHYYIGVTSGTYTKLMSKIEKLLEYLIKEHKLELFKDKTDCEIQALLWMYSFKMILTHEYMHIVLGHCDTICDERMFLWELDKRADKDYSKYTFGIKEMQAVEMFADDFSAKDAAWQIIYLANDITDIKYRLLIYYFSILLVFSIFCECGEEDVIHPKLSMRFHSMLASVNEIVIEDSDIERTKDDIEQIEKVIDDFMDIIKLYPEFFAYGIVTDFDRKEFDDYYLDLYNIASEVVKITNKNAMFPANEFEKIDKSVLEKLEMERDILLYASELGLSYEEGCNLIEKAKNMLEGDKGKK